ncbi:2-keto-4-pentenoate hydratase/2-oxohepta-3-ene-1,7-dioic acid hydratase in catechol pathway [Rhizobium sp. SJZ105]|uniref:fumarylacetoacetate hydrolase family protein n=1 Tax=Rhizobium sp. SJZ105 TaxID=2572678 RepID=UPI0011A2183E|nr:fumarylacetoacetate hydrolase family protein [Rhizobium sp. SJZ105]TWC76442.1 2-keto-4-pentenoate hydratase/2-oxohepta-3-ene-1,7-dioic acid hydratase in catechol pathway [Rhizobium sp. SJZ105]
MRLSSYSRRGKNGLALLIDGTWRGLEEGQPAFPGALQTLIEAGGDSLARAENVLKAAPTLDFESVRKLPPLSRPEKIVCVGLNYTDHSSESGFKQPDYPTIFGRFNSSLIADGDPILRPSFSEQLDYEGELVAVIGKTARDVSETDALGFVAGYSIFNDASIRDYQFKAPQWTPGKNFDDTGAFGPIFVTADELPPGCQGLKLQTRLNGEVVQNASISDMVFSVAKLVALLSEFMTLKPGDLVVTGTPSGVGLARKPPLWMQHGDTVEVEVEGIGILSNPVRDRQSLEAVKVA